MLFDIQGAVFGAMTEHNSVGRWPAQGWKLFLFSGTMPTNMTELRAVFDTSDCADLYNQATWVCGFDNHPNSDFRDMSLSLRSKYLSTFTAYQKGAVPKTVTFDQDYYLVLPNTIVSNSFTKRSLNVCTDFAGDSATDLTFYANPDGANVNFDFSFSAATEINAYRIPFANAVAQSVDWLEAYLTDAYYSISPTSVLAGTSPKYGLVPTVAQSTQFRVSCSPAYPITFFTKVANADMGELTGAAIPTWAVLAHVDRNIVECADGSDEIPLVVMSVGDELELVSTPSPVYRSTTLSLRFVRCSLFNVLDLGV